jgi:cyclophilin family peptidyl-prolyl cis-trans isomerase
MVSKESLLKLPKWKIKNFKKEIVKIILEAFKSGDVGIIAYSVDVLNKSVFDLKSEFEDLSFLTETKNNLKLPRDIEAYNAVAKLESKWLNKNYSPAKITYNNPIDWSLFDKLPDTTLAIIKTNKGDFTIKLFKNESPGSVVNFIKLADSDFFDGKKFHRVVPNFVIQTGCTRGDGYGSLDYTIRSELSQLSYNDFGFVGMASAGKDTESTQWFVTLAATPHLDGKYTIFGKVIKGMNTVFDITIGDIINSVEITK